MTGIRGRGMRWPVAARALAAVIAAAGLAAQTPPVFRGGATFVYVDAYPRRDGQLVEDLGEGDFQVSEDGAPQKVEKFEFIRHEPNPPDHERQDPNTKEDGDRQAADPHNRVFIVYLDLFHITIVGSHDARQPLLDFLDRTIGASDLFGVLTPEVSPGQLVFARKTDTLSAELAKYWPWGYADRLTTLPHTAAEREIVQNCALMADGAVAEILRLYREDEAMTNLEDLMARLRDLRDERKDLLFISEGWVPRPAETGLMGTERGALPPIGVGPGGRITTQPLQGQGGPVNQSGCDSLIRRLASIDFDRRFRALLSSARRANVTVFPIDVGGLGASTARGDRDTLLTLADNTDGLAIVDTNDLGAGFKRVADNVSSYYLLGYYSTNTAHDGRFRTIDVKVGRPGVKVTARHGYLAPSDRAAASAPAAVAASPASDAVAALPQVSTASDVFGYGVAAQDGITVVAEIARRQLDQGRWKNGGAVRAVVTNQAGASATADGRIGAGAGGAVVRVPVAPADPGPWRVIVQVTGEDGAIDVGFDVVRRGGVVLGQALAFRAQPPPRSPLDPVATFEFRRGERVHVEWAALQPVSQHQARLLDRRGQVLAADIPITERDAPSDRALVVDFNLASFAEGEYVIEVAASAGETAERRLFAFRVVP